MDKTATNDLIYLLLMLPMSVFCWTVALLGAGLLNEPEDQPVVFRFVSRVGFVPAGSVARLILGVSGLFFVNAVPLALLVAGPRGTLTILALVYFLAQAIWLATAVRDIRRAGSSDQDI